MDVEERFDLNGAWKLDKSRGKVSMRGYLEVMGVTDLAIEAYEKGEADHDTIHQIYLNNHLYRIKKISRVNNLEEEFPLNIDTSNERGRETIVTSEGLHHVMIDTKLPTINGIAKVTDVKELVKEEQENEGKITTVVLLHQKLSIENLTTSASNHMERWFIPCSPPPTALEDHGDEQAIGSKRGGRASRGDLQQTNNMSITI